MIDKDTSVATICKEGAVELSNIRRCFQPARHLHIESSKFLQFSSVEKRIMNLINFHQFIYNLIRQYFRRIIFGLGR